MRAGGVDVLQVLLLLLVEVTEHALRQHLGEADDRVQRRPQLVGHVGQELRLVLAGDLELPTLVRDLAEEPGVLDGQHRLGGKGLQQSRRPSGENAPRSRRTITTSSEQLVFPDHRHRDDRAR